ncbi:uncharacterized protein [Fopius arisanus]|uniref:Tdrd1_0 protein n=1 Tax=Fopius arisanus TaxID=64838 RepID=A0A0C9Q320_9HYME|nr:PREDICTED: uncharacterized protein LOC105262737 [Fopius arisanus]
MPASSRNTGRSEEDYSLFVTNLPVELNQDGIKKIFKEYGPVKAIMARSEGQFAFISYGTYAEAENAITSLDGQPPLYLKVQFRRRHDSGQREEHEPPQISEELCPVAPPIIPRSSVTYSQYPGHGSPVDLLRNKFSPHHYHIPPAYPVLPPHFIQYPYERINYPDTNALWTRGSMTLDAAGRRHITMGRGYTSYNISEPRARIIEDIGKVYEKRCAGIYEFGSDDCKGSFGKCMYCSRHATLCCSMCEGFYCSRACQTGDWPKHQAVCAKIPPLVGASFQQRQSAEEPEAKDSVVSRANVEVKSPKVLSQPEPTRIESKVEEKQGRTTLRRPKSVMEPNSVKVGVLERSQSIPSGIITPPVTPKTFATSATPVTAESLPTAPPPGTPTPAVKPTPFVMPQPTKTLHQDSPPQIENLMSNQGLDVKATPSTPIINTSATETVVDITDMRIHSPAANFLSSSSFTEVQITSVKEPGKLFLVQKMEDSEKLTQLMEKLNESIQQCQVVNKPMVGSIYGVIYDNIWHRGLLLSLNPLMVDYIDWGTIEELTDSGNFFRAIGSLAEPPRFSQIIRLPQKYVNESLEIDSMISVKQINVEIVNNSEVINVELLEAKKTPVAELVVEAVSSATEQEKKEAETCTSRKPPSVLDSLTAGMKLVAVIAHVIDNKTVRIVLNCEAINELLESLFVPFKENCEGRAPGYVDYQPHVDDLVAVKKPMDEYWVRGYVLKCQPEAIEIASLDEGIVITSTEKIIPLAPEYNDVCILSVTISSGSDNSLPSLETGSMIDLKVTAIKTSDSTNSDARTVEVAMRDDKSTITRGLLLTEWAPWKERPSEVAVPLMPEAPVQLACAGQATIPELVGQAEDSSLTTKKIVQRVELKHNTIVMIQSYRSPSVIFVRSLESEEIERHAQLVQDVAKSALTSPSLKSYPQVAEYVLAQFVDDNFYRAMVISSDMDSKEIKLLYIDYGDIQVTTLDKLRVMPEFLMNEICCVKKVKLYGIKSVPPTEEAITHLAKAVTNEETFVYEFHSSSKGDDYVILKSTSGESLNDEINLYLTPTWEREDNNNKEIPKEHDEMTIALMSNRTYFSLNDMEPGKLGKVGETVPGLFLETICPGSKYIFGPEDREMIVHMTTVMPEMMKKYSESTGHYIPRINELCIALFEDGAWYRGCCITPEATKTSAMIFFLDFGNSADVLYTNIREMTRDFLKPEAFGSVCCVYDFMDSTGDVAPQVQARLETLLEANGSYNVQIVSFDGNMYDIKLPDIRAQLVKEGLLQS